MKFSHALQFNAVPDWIDHYVAYDKLKKLIFQVEKERIRSASYQEQGCCVDEEKADTKNGNAIMDSETFLYEIDRQLDKIVTFYTQKEQELLNQIDELKNSMDVCHDNDSVLEHLGSSLEILDSTPRLRKTITVESRMTTASEKRRTDVDAILDTRARIILLYISLSELESYIELNRSAFDKIFKKHDKVLGGELRRTYMQKIIQNAYPFMPSTADDLHRHIDYVEALYANMFCGGDNAVAVRQMKSHLRDQITYDRNTVWRDMISQERIAHNAHAAEAPKRRYRIPFSKNLSISADHARDGACFLLGLAVFIVLLNVDIFGVREENYCFALLIFSAILWATEAIPLYATSLLIPFLIVPLKIMRNDDGTAMPASEAASATFASMFNDTIMMLLGGFALAGALSKYGIAKAFASRVLSRAGTRPRWVLLANMFVAGFLSMWISNVATPVLCFSLIDPILRTLPDNSRVGPCLILGIALACCIGGMTSPISSPQNIITLQYMDPNPGWGIWFAAALPISILTVLICWCFLLLVYRPGRSTPHLNKIQPSRGKISASQVFIMCITLLTIALWCAETAMIESIGSTGVIATIPLFLFFGTGILKKDDLHAFLWSVVVLAQGGMALGKAVTSSGLLKDIALRIKDGIQDLQPIAILCIFSFLILVFATFVSHTVAALIIIPIVQQVGASLPVPHANLLVMGAGLACSAGMALPVSGFPNMSAAMLEDASGRPYLSSKDFLIIGVPTSILCTVLIFTLGYGILAGVGY
ncbi:SPX domain-containing protein [Dichotomocladium elegans]|nr:SPX domain-containing protein [Dichotomocladium elegans]